MIPEAIARRRTAFDEAQHLSDWQVHSAHIAAGAIGTVVSDFQTGPLYVPMPTGSGKTVGAIWGGERGAIAQSVLPDALQRGGREGPLKIGAVPRSGPSRLLPFRCLHR